jgi:hypothetical protein
MLLVVRLLSGLLGASVLPREVVRRALYIGRPHACCAQQVGLLGVQLAVRLVDCVSIKSASQQRDVRHHAWATGQS